MWQPWVLLVITTVVAKETGNDVVDVKAHPGRKVVCYFGSWSTYRPSFGKFDVESIDPFLCTHLIYGFTGIRNGVVTPLDPYNDLCQDYGQGAFKRFNLLKKQNPRLVTMVAIGGWNEGSVPYSKMASTLKGRYSFISSVVRFLERYEFDGFDLDWEYPAHRGGKPEDKANFALLVKEMRGEFDKHGYFLSAAVSAGESTIKNAYDVKTISSYLDFINVMTYDFHGAWDMVTGHHSPLYMNALDKGSFETFNVNHSIQYWISQGAHREKIVLGIGAYGRGVVLENESKHGIYAPGKQPLPPAPYTQEAGYWGYNEICEVLKTGNWTVERDPQYVAPYAYQGRYWVGYDDVESVKVKSKYILENGLGGGMVWSIETDDFRGVCHGESFPLIKTLYRTLIGKYPPHQWKPSSPNTGICRHDDDGDNEISSSTDASHFTTEGPTTSPPSLPPHAFCKKSGHNYPDPGGNCQKFVQCALHGQTWSVYEFSCGPGTIFNEQFQTCVLPSTNSSSCNVTFVSYNRQGSL